MHRAVRKILEKIADLWPPAVVLGGITLVLAWIAFLLWTASGVAIRLLW